MQRKTIAIAGGLLLATTFGCKTADEKRVDERDEAHKEMGRAQENLNEQREELADRGTDKQYRDVQRAKEELAEEQTEAKKEVRKADEQYDRFQAFKRDESREAFTARAESAIKEIESELTRMDGLMSNARPDRTDEIRDDLNDARRNCNEARKDLAEVRDQTGGVIDDGRLGVAFAINRARRSLEDAADGLIVEPVDDAPKTF